MPYNRSKSTIIRNQSYLRDMAEAQRDLFFPSANPRKLAYKIREALHATLHHPEFKHLTYLRDFFEISPIEGGVRARYLGEPRFDMGTDYTPLKREKADGTIITADPVTGEREVTPLAFTVPMQDPTSRMKIPEVETLPGIVGAAIKYRAETEEINFPRAILNEEDKQKLWLWGQSSGWRFIDHEEDGTTITKKPVDESILWSPEEV